MKNDEVNGLCQGMAHTSTPSAYSIFDATIMGSTLPHKGMKMQQFSCGTPLPSPLPGPKAKGREKECHMITAASSVPYVVELSPCLLIPTLARGR